MKFAIAIGILSQVVILPHGAIEAPNQNQAENDDGWNEFLNDLNDKAKKKKNEHQILGGRNKNNDKNDILEGEGHRSAREQHGYDSQANNAATGLFAGSTSRQNHWRSFWKSSKEG